MGGGGGQVCIKLGSNLMLNPWWGPKLEDKSLQTTIFEEKGELMELGIKPTLSTCRPNTLLLDQNWLTSEPLMEAHPMFIQPAVGEEILAEIPDPPTCMI